MLLEMNLISSLVGGFNPSEKYESVGMMKFPTEWKVIKNHLPNHQPVEMILISNQSLFLMVQTVQTYNVRPPR